MKNYAIFFIVAALTGCSTVPQPIGREIAAQNPDPASDAFNKLVVSEHGWEKQQNEIEQQLAMLKKNSAAQENLPQIQHRFREFKKGMQDLWDRSVDQSGRISEEIENKLGAAHDQFIADLCQDFGINIALTDARLGNPSSAYATLKVIKEKTEKPVGEFEDKLIRFEISENRIINQELSRLLNLQDANLTQISFAVREARENGHIDFIMKKIAEDAELSALFFQIAATAGEKLEKK